MPPISPRLPSLICPPLLAYESRNWWSRVSPQMGLLLLLFYLLFLNQAVAGAGSPSQESQPIFAEAPHYVNGPSCPKPPSSPSATCHPSDVHIAMTLDAAYLRGTVAAVFSILHHSSCPTSTFFHFIASADHNSIPSLSRTLRSAFPSLRFKVYPFRSDTVSPLISPSVRAALDNPLNYARNHLADLLDPCVRRVVYLDSDVIVVDDIRKLYSTRFANPSAVIAAPEYCHADLTRYFTAAFWADKSLSGTFDDRSRKPCYFNTGVMVMDLERWRRGDYGAKIRQWMEVQREGRPRIYDLGSLPPFLLVFAGEVEAVDHRWNQHGLGGDNEQGRCRPLHRGSVSLLHWSGKGKPWARLDAGTPCPVDHLWAPYDLYLAPSRSASQAL